MNDLLSWMMPEQASTLAPTIDWMFYFITWVSIFFFVLVVALMLWFTFKYRRRSDSDPAGKGLNHHTGLEVTWSVLPCFIVVFMFWEGMVGYAESLKAPEGSINYTAVASQWKWDFYYPNGKSDTQFIHAVKDQPYKINLTSNDVLHAFFVPAFRVKSDVVPGKYSSVWFEATKSGDFRIFCAEFCGDSHSQMMATVRVHETKESYDKAMEEMGGPEKRDDGTVESMAHFGWKLFDSKGCAQCHSRGLEPGTQAPGWKELGELLVSNGKRQLTGGRSVDVNEEYIRKSIYEPRADIVEPWPAVMSAQNINDVEMMGIIEYIRWLGTNDAEKEPPFVQ